MSGWPCPSHCLGEACSAVNLKFSYAGQHASSVTMVYVFNWVIWSCMCYLFTFHGKYLILLSTPEIISYQPSTVHKRISSVKDSAACLLVSCRFFLELPCSAIYISVLLFVFIWVFNLLLLCTRIPAL